MKGVSIPELTNPTAYLWLHTDRWDAAVFAGLSANLQAKIMASPEYIDMMNERDGSASIAKDDHHEMEDIPF
jgi:hypothetical protein